MSKYNENPEDLEMEMDLPTHDCAFRLMSYTQNVIPAKAG